MPTFEPDPFSARHVQQRSEDRFMTDTEIASQTLVGQLARRIHRQFVGPLGVVEEMFDIDHVHGRDPYHNSVRVSKMGAQNHTQEGLLTKSMALSSIWGS